MRCSTKPIQNATPKNSYGVKPEKRLVAKNIQMMGRMVATASPTEKARIIHSRCTATPRCRICQNALHSANRKNGESLPSWKKRDAGEHSCTKGPRGLAGHRLASAAALRYTRPASRKRKPNCSAHRDSPDPDGLLAGGAAELLRLHRLLPAHFLD